MLRSTSTPRDQAGGTAERSCRANTEYRHFLLHALEPRLIALRRIGRQQARDLGRTVNLFGETISSPSARCSTREAMLTVWPK